MGFDLRANETLTIDVGGQATVKTGIAIQIPIGHVGLVRDRAGISTKMGLHTAAGTFDPAYRGEVSVVLMNLGNKDVEIEKGMRIAQMIILPVTKVKIREMGGLSHTNRHERGFGSTGVKEIIRELKEYSNKGNPHLIESYEELSTKIQDYDFNDDE